jgi:2'-5' RNA ligase
VTPYRPFITDPEHIARLEGQPFVVLRPAGAIEEIYAQVQGVVKVRLAGLPVSYPAQPHVTLTGFPKGTPLASVRDLVAQWASTISDVQIEAERVSFFPAPFQIVIVQVRKTAALFHALASLRERATRRDFGDVLTTPPADWIFHMSVAYCASLSESAWAEVMRLIEAMEMSDARCVVTEVEIVAFDGGREYSGGVFELSHGTTQVG